MEMQSDITTKILVYDDDRSIDERLKACCKDHSLILLKASRINPLDILDKNTDLGAIIISDTYQFENISVLEMARVLHRGRPELPIFLRLSSKSETIITDEDHAIAGTFSFDDMKSFDEILHRHLFTKFYPVPLIRGIQEVSNEAIRANIKNCDIETSSPYLVKDQIIYGELLSLMPMESNWYRGYMMLQTTEQEALNMISYGYTTFKESESDSRYVVSLLNEITNLIWGGIKSRFNMYSDQDDVNATMRTQVPISINHQQKFISFGTTDPQLCFHYRIRDPKKQYHNIDLYQKFVFNLSWYPEDFKESDTELNKMVDSGELEFF